MIQKTLTLGSRFDVSRAFRREAFWLASSQSGLRRTTRLLYG